jgi:hypothetical protein
MARLLPLLIFIVGLVAFFIARQQSTRARSDRVYRPRATPGGFTGRATGRDAPGDAGTNWVVRRGELEGVRDAYSSAAIDPDAPLWCCAACQACYHRQSVEALRAQNAGRCALCGSADLRRMHVI